VFDGGTRATLADGRSLQQLTLLGSFGEYCIVSDQQAVPVPKEIPFDTGVSAVAFADAVLLVDRQRIGVGKQPALGLGEMQADSRRLPAIREKLADIFHMGAGLVLFGELFQRHEGGSQRFDDDPFVVPCDSLSWHRVWGHPKSVIPRLRRLRDGQNSSDQGFDGS